MSGRYPATFHGESDSGSIRSLMAATPAVVLAAQVVRALATRDGGVPTDRAPERDHGRYVVGGIEQRTLSLLWSSGR